MLIPFPSSERMRKGFGWSGHPVGRSECRWPDGSLQLGAEAGWEGSGHDAEFCVDGGVPLDEVVVIGRALDGVADRVVDEDEVRHEPVQVRVEGGGAADGREAEFGVRDTPQNSSTGYHETRRVAREAGDDDPGTVRHVPAERDHGEHLVGDLGHVEAGLRVTTDVHHAHRRGGPRRERRGGREHVAAAVARDRVDRSARSLDPHATVDHTAHVADGAEAAARAAPAVAVDVRSARLVGLAEPEAATATFGVADLVGRTVQVLVVLVGRAVAVVVDAVAGLVAPRVGRDLGDAVGGPAAGAVVGPHAVARRTTALTDAFRSGRTGVAVTGLPNHAFPGHSRLRARVGARGVLHVGLAAVGRRVGLGDRGVRLGCGVRLRLSAGHRRAARREENETEKAEGLHHGET